MRLNNYNANLEWIPGKEMIFVDHLSRNVGQENSEVPTCTGLDLKINDVFLNASNDRCISLTQESDKDETLVALKNVIIKGWPQMRSECPLQLRDFWLYRDELSILDGLVLKDTRIIIPNACCDEVLAKLHEGHFGVERTKLRARDSVYWPSMYKDIESMVRSCDKCQEFSRRNQKDPIIPRELPLVAWTLLELDLFTCDNSNFLLVVDVTSRFPIVRILPSESSKSVINALKGIYCDFGLPKRVLSDNGPCFRSFEFIDFHAKLNVKVEKCSAYNHNSVGSVERMVQTIKQIMMKNADEAWLAMLIYRSTNIPGLNKSPGEILNGRKYRTGLPVVDIRSRDSEIEIETFAENRSKMAITGSGRKELPKLPVGTEIMYEFNPDADKNK